MHISPAEIGRIVRAARRAQGLRQDQLAGAAGVGVRFLSELERGKPTVRLEKVLAVLNALGCRLHVEMPPDAREPREGDAAARVAAEEGVVPAGGDPLPGWSSE
jgi:y4mF family transcriptional regulator